MKKSVLLGIVAVALLSVPALAGETKYEGDWAGTGRARTAPINKEVQSEAIKQNTAILAVSLFSLVVRRKEATRTEVRSGARNKEVELEAIHKNLRNERKSIWVLRKVRFREIYPRQPNISPTWSVASAAHLRQTRNI